MQVRFEAYLWAPYRWAALLARATTDRATIFARPQLTLEQNASLCALSARQNRELWMMERVSGTEPFRLACQSTSPPT